MASSDWRASPDDGRDPGSPERSHADPLRGPVEALTAGDLHAVLTRARDAFAVHREEIDALNVFPVPDGDTGTNLLLTLRGALEEFDAAGGRPETTSDGGEDNLDVRAGDEHGRSPHGPQLLARNIVMSARGNSGVIFSQVVRGFADVLDEYGPLDVAGFRAALVAARDYAYETVAEPIEGTMLSAIAAAADSAAGSEDDGGDGRLDGLVVRVGRAVHAAVQRTPDQLEVLRQRGVVDAGARGFEVFCATVVAFVCGGNAADLQSGASTDNQPVRRSRDATEHGPDATADADRTSPSSTTRFEVVYRLDGEDIDAGMLRERLSRIGDSVVVTPAAGAPGSSGDTTTCKVHVHTDDVGAVLEVGLAVGRPADIDVTSIDDQTDTPGPPGGHAEDDGTVGAIAVLPGAGLTAAAGQLGATVVPGGAGQLPTVAELLNAVGEAPGRRVLLLPGHPDVLAAARQASAVSAAEGGRELIVVDTADSVPAVLAALAVYESESPLGPAPESPLGPAPGGRGDQIVQSVTRAAAGCRHGEVVPVTREATTPVGEVAVGDLFAVIDHEVAAAIDDPVGALRAVADRLDIAAAELVTLVVGAEVDARMRGEAEAQLAALAPDADVQVIDGGHKPVVFYLGVE